MPFTPIETQRLRLRLPEERDAGALSARRSDPENARYLPRESLSHDEAAALIAATLAVEPGTPGAWCQLLIETREDGATVGDLGFQADARWPQVFEIGYVVDRAHHGRGYATEAVRGALGYLFGPLGAHRVFGNMDARNVASARVLERAGMRREAHHLEDWWLRGEWTSSYIYAVLRREWAG